MSGIVLFRDSEATAETEILGVFKTVFYILKIKIKSATPCLRLSKALEIKSKHLPTALTYMIFLLLCFSLLLLLGPLLPSSLTSLWPHPPSSISFNPPAPGPLNLLSLLPSACNALSPTRLRLAVTLIYHSPAASLPPLFRCSDIHTFLISCSAIISIRLFSNVPVYASHLNVSSRRAGWLHHSYTPSMQHELDT